METQLMVTAYNVEIYNDWKQTNNPYSPEA